MGRDVLARRLEEVSLKYIDDRKTDLRRLRC